MERKNLRFLKIFYWIVLGGLLFRSIESFILNTCNNLIIAGTLTLNSFILSLPYLFVSLDIFLIILSICAIVIFTKNKLPKITLVYPIYDVTIVALSFLTLIIWRISSSSWILPDSVSSIMHPIGLILTVCEGVFIVYILYKFR